MDLFEKCYGFAAVDQAIAAGIYPYCPVISSCQGPSVTLNGHETIMVGSSNYLGLSGDPRVIKAAHEALDAYGTGSTGTRLFNGTTDLHLKLERELAEFVGKEAAVVFPTGFQSNLCIISAIAGEDDIIFGDDLNHASILAGIGLSKAEYIEFPHDDYDKLELLLSEADPAKGKLIVIDGVFSFDGTLADIGRLISLKNKYGARLMVDDSHGFGVVGKSGRGTIEALGYCIDDIDIYMATFSKSLVSLGGFMAADSKVVQYVSHIALPYTNTAALPPVNVAVISAALSILKDHPELPATACINAEYLRSLLKERGIPFTVGKAPIVSVKIGDELKIYAFYQVLLSLGVYSNVLVDNGLVRMCISAAHTKEQLDTVCEKVCIAYQTVCGQ